jgi:cytosine/uracil/thiamine/allantoin permease
MPILTHCPHCCQNRTKPGRMIARILALAILSWAVWAVADGYFTAWQSIGGALLVAQFGGKL